MSAPTAEECVKLRPSLGDWARELDFWAFVTGGMVWVGVSILHALASPCEAC